MRRTALPLLLALALPAFPASTLTLERARLLRAGDPAEAVSALRELKGDEAADYLLAEALLRAHSPREARERAEVFEALHPGSPLVFRARLVSAWSSLQLRELRVGLERLVGVIGGGDPGAAREARRSLLDWADSGLVPPAELLRLPAGLPATAASDTLLDGLTAAFARRPGASAEGPVVLLLPQSGEYGAIGRRMARGAQAALAEAGAEGILLEEPADPDSARRLVRGLLQLVRPRALVGPLLSGPAEVVALEVGRSAPGVRLVLPAATNPGLSTIAPDGWQLNLTTSAQGEAAARHAWDCLGRREAWIVQPRGEYGDAVADGFEAEFRRRGGRIVRRLAYPAGRTDFRAHLETVRKGFLEAARGRGQDTAALDPLVFAPAETPSEAAALGAQARALGLSPVWLGASGWHSRQFLAEAGGRMDGATVVTDWVPDETRPEWKAFVAAWRRRSTETLDRLAALGWDAARLVVQGFPAAGEPRAGAQGEFRFDGRRANLQAPVLRVEAGGFRPATCSAR